MLEKVTSFCKDIIIKIIFFPTFLLLKLCCRVRDSLSSFIFSFQGQELFCGNRSLSLAGRKRWLIFVLAGLKETKPRRRSTRLRRRLSSVSVDATCSTNLVEVETLGCMIEGPPSLLSPAACWLDLIDCTPVGTINWPEPGFYFLAGANSFHASFWQYFRILIFLFLFFF